MDTSDRQTGQAPDTAVEEGAALPAGPAAPPAPAGTRTPRRRGSARLVVARFALPLIFVLFVVVFSVLKPDLFPTADNLSSLLQTQSVLAILAVALVVPLAIGEFDLSVGATLGLGAIVVTGLPSKSGLPLVPAILVAVAVCGAAGLVNGLIVVRGGVNSLIVTLATGSVITGSVLWYTEGNVIYSDIPPGLLAIGSTTLLGVPLPAFYLLVVAVVAWFVLEQTPLGRYVYAIGGSKEAAALAGISVRPLRIWAFVGSGLLSGVAGVVQSAQLGSGNPTIGPNFLLPAFAAAFLGATTLRIGTFNVIGTVLAVFALAVGVNGLTLLGVPFFVTPVFQGVALLLAVGATRYLRQETV